MAFWKRTDEPLDGTETSLIFKSTAQDSPAALAPAETPAPSVVTPSTVLRPSLGRDTSVTGKLSFNAPTRIDGKLKGEVRATDLLVVGPDGVVDGVVRALKLVVQGEIRGEVYVTEHVEITSTGRVSGSLETQSLVVGEGGCLDGDCRIAPPRGSLHVLRPANA